MEAYSFNKPNLIMSFQTDLKRNFYNRFVIDDVTIYMRDVISECEMYACDICLSFHEQSGGVLPDDWVKHIADQTWRAICTLWPEVPNTYSLETCVSNVYRHTRNLNLCQLLVNKHYKR